MNKITFFLLASCICLVFASCHHRSESASQARLQSLMGKWYKKKIIFPKNLVVVNDITGKRVQTKHNIEKYKVVHYFTADCDKCIDELTKVQKFISQNQNLPVEYIFIACGPTDIYVKQAIEQSKFAFPVYFDDEYYGFKLVNKLPLNNNVYNTMLLNKGNEVLLFGHFFGNEKAKELFMNILNE